ncbi:MAG: type III-A CRISPR-associated RAMP protein Csm4 [Blastocatellia bacterium]|nr:type III-A CRISPR-associated RAMP protein Csm4 [Blastocatellia bacterium]MCS7158669.1 type III-A CRISPR-associated RAMP protein Csm4 [Blastocatellia bacterium]MCX7753173.1 type III-A CRISPR-associated RAMP protein Csm4 [Blastocatellia bacterium]MDW8168210.1 type III-A CRISPR-associated RAMP protein Csm4 [Acidobacteriota bacterium]MDW8255487.1 type III-A CRISPR-associated RAMP protein Csm4 [Acidobacteriota bacterium]
MSSLAIYRLRFRSPFRIGERGVGLEVTRMHVPADTLFAALCSTWRELYGIDALRRDVLDWFTEGEPGAEPFFLTSAFPYAGDVRFFPKPLGRLPHVRLAEGDEKAFKRVHFVSERIFTAVVRGESVTFRKLDCINGGIAWVTEEERTRLAEWTDDMTGDIVFLKTAVVPRVTLDRITAASEIWHLGEVLFARGTGLWFAVAFNAEHGEALRRRFDAVLRVLGDTGLGGERGAGCGLFEIEGLAHETFPDVPGASRFVTLSPICPKDVMELDRLTQDGAAYEVMPRRGWVTSPEAANLRRKTVWMFAEGSVLTGPPLPCAGRLVNVKPDVCPHDVWRYGYAFPVGLATRTSPLS